MASLEVRRLRDEVVTLIVERIANGVYEVDTPLPAERQLAAELGVGRSSIREAIRVLEQIGVIDVRPGRGSFIRSDAPSTAMLMRVRAASSNEYSPFDLLVARLDLEPSAAARAARQRTERDLERLDEIIEGQEALTEDGDPAPMDRSFHIEVARIGRNRVIEDLVGTCVHAMADQQSWRIARQLTQEVHGALDNLLEHQQIHKAIVDGDADAARRSMIAHLESVRERVERSLDSRSHWR